MKLNEDKTEDKIANQKFLAKYLTFMGGVGCSLSTLGAGFCSTVAIVNYNDTKDEHYLIPISFSIGALFMAGSAAFFAYMCYDAINDKPEEYLIEGDDETPLTVVGDSSEV